MIQPSPIAAEIAVESQGLASLSQRLGVTPLVLLLKRSGNTSARSLTVVLRKSSEWIAATPLVLWDPTIATLAMRTCCGLALLNEAHASGASGVIGMMRVNVVEKPAVDLEDDLELARNEEAHPFDRPTLERLGKQRVVGVGERRARDIPRFVPAEMRFVEQDAHELRHGEGRMRVVELNGGFLGQKPPIGIRLPKPANRVGQRTGDEEIFLHEPQRAPLLRMVVRIENAGERFGVERLGDRGDEIAAAELAENRTNARRSRSTNAAC